MSTGAANDLPVVVVIFGASGDLTRRKLVPALFSLHAKGRLTPRLHIVGFATRPLSDDDFRALVSEFVSGPDAGAPSADWKSFAACMSYRSGNFNNPEDFAALAADLEEIAPDPCGRLFYVAAPPDMYAAIVRGLASAGLMRSTGGWRRVVVEKPFGRDLPSARDLNALLHQVAAETQIYRIDHYLGKETVQNVLVFRFANTVFEPIWNRNYVDHVQITVAEDLGVEHRGKSYDRVGVVRDMFQNHLLQVLSMVAMEPPTSFNADALRDEKHKLLMALRPPAAEDIAADTVRGQYAGYLREAGVDPASQTPTFAAVRLFIDNWRWHGVPFYLRSGKCLARKLTEVVLQFKRPPHLMFPLPRGADITPNILALCLQPDEGIHLRFEAKQPDTQIEFRSVDMEFHYRDSFGASAIPEAYERLLLDALHGDASLFTRSDEIEAAWAWVDSIDAGWQTAGAPTLQAYAPGTWGPPQADAFLARDGRTWSEGCRDHP
jgi:glucose-6-phosphate 1-dehydrogenase